MGLGLNFEIEWLDAPGVSDSALRRTWARFVLRNGARDGSAITECADPTAAEAVRPSVYGSLLPMGEWILRCWPYLLAERREPGPQPTTQRRWRARHAWRSGREGMAFPDLLTVPHRERVVFGWRPDPGPLPPGSVRFLSEGEVLLPPAAARDILVRLLKTLVGRLAGLDDPRAHEFVAAFEHFYGLSDAERRRREIVARLGLSPEEVDAGLDRLVDSLASAPCDPITEALLDAADPHFLAVDCQAARRWWRACEEGEAFPRVLGRLREELGDAEGGPSRLVPPWEVGWRRAQALRAHLKGALRGFVSDGDPPARHVERLVDTLVGNGGQRVRTRRLEDPVLDGVVAWAAQRAPLVVITRRCGRAGRAFRLARELYALLYEGDPASSFARIGNISAHRALSEANAFAAEWLLPVESLRRDLGGAQGVSDLEVLRVARRWMVAPQLVGHQVRNHRLATVEGDV